jgi:hypothetical protein
LLTYLSWFVATNITKFKLILFLNGKELNLSQFTMKYSTKKFSLSSQKHSFGIRDTRSEKTYYGSYIPDPGVKKAPNPGSGSATLIEAAAKIVAEDHRKIMQINSRPTLLLATQRKETVREMWTLIV